MKKIETYRQLEEEKQFTKRKIAQLEFLIEEDVAQIKASLHPWTNAGHAVRNMVSSDKDGIMGESIGLTVDTLIKKLLLRKSGWITKLVVSFLVKNFAKNLVSKNAENILGWIVEKMRPSNNHSKEYHHASTSDVDWDT